jgi:hypothetical protein
MKTRNVMKTWGTWYTGEGERADAWPEETRSAGGPGVRARDALVSASRHGLGGSGPGLSGVIGESLLQAGRSPAGSLL